MKILLNEFDASTYGIIWKESNVLVVLLSYLSHNSAIALDVSCQCEMMEICANLLAFQNSDPAVFTMIDIDLLLVHLLKIINIYGHLVSNTKPLIIPKKGQKNDIFISSKEMSLINYLGFFSNDNFYMKLFLMLKNSHANYQV